MSLLSSSLVSKYDFDVFFACLIEHVFCNSFLGAAFDISSRFWPVLEKQRLQIFRIRAADRQVLPNAASNFDVFMFS